MATSITFQFWSSPNNIDWTGPHSDIADVADSRYIKVKASLSGDANMVPILEDMTVGYFKKSNILANWIYFNYSKEDAQKKTKTWTTKADFEAGSLSNLWVPAGLNRLELKRLSLSGTGTFILDAGADKTANWVTFGHTNPNQNIYYRDDFRDNSLAAWTIVGGTWQGVNQYMRGTGNLIWQYNRVRVGPTTWAGTEILFKAYLTSPFHNFFLRADSQADKVNSYGVQIYATGQGESCYLRVANGAVLETVPTTGQVPANTWYWFRIQIYTSGGNVIARTKWWLPGSSEPGWVNSHTFSGIWRSSGCFSYGRHSFAGENRYDDILISRKEGIPSPPNCSVSFKFWASNDGTSWGSQYTDITKVPNSRFIKIQATLSRTSLLSAMPTLEDMTVGYFLKG